MDEFELGIKFGRLQKHSSRLLSEEINHPSSIERDRRRGVSMLNDPENVVLHAEDEKALKAVSDRLTRPLRHLSFFERRDAMDLGKSLDSHGNLDLNESANEARQTSGQRKNPNVQVPDGFTHDQPFSEKSAHFISQAEKTEKTLLKSLCHRHCHKSWGRPNCKHCLGQGTITGDKMGQQFDVNRPNQ